MPNRFHLMLATHPLMLDVRMAGGNCAKWVADSVAGQPDVLWACW